MKISSEIEGSMAVIDISGDVVASNAQALKEEASSLSEKGCNHILLEMSKVGFLDSTGLSVCMTIYEMLNKKSGMLVMTRANDAIKKVLRVTGADRKIQMAASKAEGIEILKGRPGGPVS